MLWLAQDFKEGSARGARVSGKAFETLQGWCLKPASRDVASKGAESVT